MPAPTLESAFVRILINDSAGRAAAGAGFLAAPRHVLTCAHVVNTALRRAQTAPEQPDTLLALDFPLLPDQILLHAKILRWFPVRENAAVGELEDIAVLELPEDAPLPAGAQPAPLVLFEEHWGRQVRLHGFSVPAGTYANLTLQGLNTQGLIELHHQGSGVVAPGFSGTAVWSVQGNAVCGMAVAVWKELNTAYMIPAVSLFKACPEIDIYSRSVNPYKGLEAFREKDARFYFGRKDDADELRKKIEQQPFTAVIGASGSGKSSLVFAGLLPILRQSGDWLLAACRPKQQPFHELSASLIPFLYEDELERVKKSRQCAADLLSGELHLSDLLQRIAERNDCRRFLLLVDQFEELYTLNADRALARAFVAQLLAAQADGFRAVITLRADFLEAALGDEAFAKTLNACQPLYLSPLDSKGLRLAVERPAELLGIRFEAGLADLIVADVGTEPGGLPLLEFCLTQLWEQQEHMKITHKAYTAIGGVRQALARHADTVLAEFEQEAVRRIFFKLVRVGQGTEDTRQVAALADFQEEQRGLIKQLADRRLLVTSGDKAGQQVEVAHEALIRHWQTLRKWVEAKKEFLVWRDKLRVLLQQWQKNGHDEGALLRGLPLGEALQWRGSHAEELDEKELNFIEASEQHRERERQERESAQRERERLLLEVNYNLAKVFEEKALTAWNNVQEDGKDKTYQKAILFTAACLRQSFEIKKFPLNPDLTGKLFLNEFFSNSLSQLWVSTEKEWYVDSVSFSYDSKKIAFSSSDNKIHLFDIYNNIELAVFDGHTDKVASVSFSPDGIHLASASHDGTIRLWDIKNLKESKVFKGHLSYVNKVSFSPDGSLLASASFDCTARIWNVKNYKQISVYKDESIYGHSTSVESISFSPDGNKLAYCSYCTIWIRDIKKRGHVKILKGHSDGVNEIYFNNDGTILASSSKDKTVRLWDVKSGNELKVLTDNGSPYALAFNPDGTILAYSKGKFGNYKLLLYDIKSGNELRAIDHSGYGVTNIAFSPDGTMLAMSCLDTKKSIRLIDVTMNKEKRIFRCDSRQTLFSKDGAKLASACRDNTVRLFDVASRTELIALKGHNDSVSGISFSRDGMILASYSLDSTVRLWDFMTQRAKKVFTYPDYKITSISFSQNDSVLVCALYRRESSCNEGHIVRVILLDLINDKEYELFSSFYNEIESIFISNDESRLVLSTFNSTVIVNIENYKYLHKREISGYTVESSGEICTQISNDGLKLSIASYCNVKLFDIDSCRELSRFKSSDCLSKMSFSPDDKQIVSVSKNRTLHMWDIESSQKLMTFEGHSDSVISVSFSPKGDIISSSSLDGTIRLWNLRPYKLFLHGGKPTPLYFTFIEAAKFLWELDVQGLEIVHKERTPADMERFGSLLAPPPPGQSKFDQVLEWAEKQQGQ